MSPLFTPVPAYFAYYLPGFHSKARLLWVGLEAQRAAARSCLQGAAPVGELGGEWREDLTAAIAVARAAGGVLLVAKLGRLVRNADFILARRNSKVQFACYDMPDASTLTVSFFAFIAQRELYLLAHGRRRAGRSSARPRTLRRMPGR